MGRVLSALKYVFAGIGFAVGIIAGLAFYFDFKNYDAVAFAGFSGIIAAVMLTVHILNWRQYWTYPEHRSLIRLMYTGCFIQLIGVVGTVVYIVLGSLDYSNTKKFDIKGRNYFITTVWTFMTWKWGFALFYFSRKYLRDIRKDGYEVPVTEN